jgi:outer membrane protein assembly factor BamB
LRQAAWTTLALALAGSDVRLPVVSILTPTIPAARAAEPLLEESIYFPTDRASMQRLATASKLFDEKRYGEAVRLLGSLLEAPEDYFFRPKGQQQQVYHSLKTEAQRLLGTMPAEGRESYETQFGAEAQRLLDEAVAASDADRLAEVSRRFFHTRAGYEATELLGTIHMERGRPLPAALCFKRLKETPAAAERFEPALSLKLAVCWARAGQWQNAVDAIEQFKGTFTISGRKYKPFEGPIPPVPVTPPGQWTRKPTARDIQALAWLEQIVEPARHGSSPGAEQWTLFRGDPSRNAVSRGGAPLLNRRWAVPLTNDPRIERLTELIEQAYLDQGIAAVPSIHPLAVNDYIFTRTVAGLVAVDFKTGKRIWSGPTDESVRAVLESSNTEPTANAMFATWLDERLWDDSIYGSLSSDGRSVFCIEDLTEDMSSESGRQTVAANGRVLIDSASRPQNRLAAYSIADEGKLEWDLSGAGPDERSELAGAFFLGPPLPLSGLLYTLAEIKGEIRLLAFRPKVDPETRAKTVSVEWSQQLAMVERTIVEDASRRLAGAIPSYADGILVCPTSAGAVVAVDLTTRSLLWGYRYQRGDEMPMRGRAAMMQSVVGAGTENDHWADATVTIADGHVLVTPVEVVQSVAGGAAVPELHCLSLLDGKRLWVQPRETGIYVAAVHDGLVTVVGSSHVRQYRLTDGKIAWTTPLPQASFPSGRGFFNDGQYFLPLTTAEVATIDLKDGRIVARAKSRSGTIPGNLVCYGGEILSQSPANLESFYQLDELRSRVAKTLAEHPGDPAALALRAELVLEAGKLDEALDLLRRSFAARPDPRTRQLLIDCLLEGLRGNFARDRGAVPELEGLVDQPAQRLAALRVLAVGLQESGDVLPAFEAYLKLVDLEPIGSDELERIAEDAPLQVRRDQWVQARLRSLRATAGEQERSAIDAALRRRLDLATEADSTEALRRFVSYFDGQPIAEDAITLLAARVAGVASPLESEQLWRRLAQSDDPQRARPAVASLVRMLKEHRRLDEAGALVERLRQWSDDVCLDGKTGKQLLSDWFPDAADKSAIGRLDGNDWPTGVVNQEPLKSQSAQPTRVFAVDIRGSRGPFFDRSTIEFDQQAQSLAGRDELGRERWRVAIGSERTTYGFNHSVIHTRVDGHLLVASMGLQLIAVDTLGNTGKGAPRILWRQELTELLPNMVRPPAPPRAVNMPWGVRRFIANDASGRPVGATGPVSSQRVCFQRQRQLTAVHPLTGKPLWMRGGIEPGSDVFGDDELLFVAAPNSTNALVVRAIDGHEMGRRTVPVVEQRLAVLGRRVLIWSTVGGRASLKWRDVWSESDVWEKTFSAGSKPWPIEEQAVGVLEPNGHFAVMNLADGARQIDAQLEPEPALTEIFINRTAERDLLITNRPWSDRGGDNVQPFPGSGFGNPLHGNLYGFDRATGKLVFTTPIDGRGLSFHQPAGLPFLLFAAQVYPRQRSMRESQPQVGILCIDKRTGHVIYNERTQGPFTTIEVVGDRQNHQAILRTPRMAVRLTFTAAPWPAGDAQAGKPVEPLTTRAGRVLGRSFQEWLESHAFPIVPPLLGQ